MHQMTIQFLKLLNGAKLEKSNPIKNKISESCFIITRQEKGFYIFTRRRAQVLFKKHNNKLIFVQSKKNNGFAAGNNVVLSTYYKMIQSLYVLC